MNLAGSAVSKKKGTDVSQTDKCGWHLDKLLIRNNQHIVNFAVAIKRNEECYWRAFGLIKKDKGHQ